MFYIFIAFPCLVVEDDKLLEKHLLRRRTAEPFEKRAPQEDGGGNSLQERRKKMALWLVQVGQKNTLPSVQTFRLHQKDENTPTTDRLV